MESLPDDIVALIAVELNDMDRTRVRRASRALRVVWMRVALATPAIRRKIWAARAACAFRMCAAFAPTLHTGACLAFGKQAHMTAVFSRRDTWLELPYSGGTQRIRGSASFRYMARDFVTSPAWVATLCPSSGVLQSDLAAVDGDAGITDAHRTVLMWLISTAMRPRPAPAELHLALFDAHVRVRHAAADHVQRLAAEHPAAFDNGRACSQFDDVVKMLRTLTAGRDSHADLVAGAMSLEDFRRPADADRLHAWALRVIDERLIMFMAAEETGFSIARSVPPRLRHAVE